MLRSSQPLVGFVKRLLCAVAGVTSLWALGIFLSGGFNLRVLGIRISSQNPYRAAMVSLACAAIASTLHTARPTRTGLWRREWLRPEWIVTAVGVCLLIWQWGAARPLWLDEQMIALNFRDRTFWDLSGPLSFDQSAPFGWLLLERTALLGLGANELALRLAPALFGIATLLCALFIGQRWMSPVGATAFALLCAFGQWLSFYAVELKHYSADAFSGLLLPALTVWVTEADANEIRTRLAVWGAVVAVAHWFSIGALLVTPVCAALLAIVLMRVGRGPARCTCAASPAFAPCPLPPTMRQPFAMRAKASTCATSGSLRFLLRRAAPWRPSRGCAISSTTLPSNLAAQNWRCFSGRRLPQALC